MTDRDAPRSDSPADPPQWGQGPAGGWGAPRESEQPTQVWPEGWPSSPDTGREPGADERTVLHGAGPAADDDDATVVRRPGGAHAASPDEQTVDRSGSPAADPALGDPEESTVARGAPRGWAPRGEDRTVAWPGPPGRSAAPSDPGRTVAWNPADDEDRTMARPAPAADQDRTVAWNPADDEDRTMARPAPASGQDRTAAWKPTWDDADADRTEVQRPPSRTASPVDDRTVATPPPGSGEDRTVAWSSAPPDADRTVAALPPGTDEDRTVAWPAASGGVRAGPPSPAAPPGWAAAPPWPGPDGVRPQGPSDPAAFRPADAHQPGWAGPPQQPGWGAPPPPPAQWSPAVNGPPAPAPPLPDGPTLPRRGKLPWILGALALLVVAVALILAFVAPGFLVTRVFDRVAVQKGVAQILGDSYQISGVTDVSCPDGVKVQPGDTFTCDAAINGEPKKVTVRITSSSGDYEVQRPQ